MKAVFLIVTGALWLENCWAQTICVHASPTISIGIMNKPLFSPLVGASYEQKIVERFSISGGFDYIRTDYKTYSALCFGFCPDLYIHKQMVEVPITFWLDASYKRDAKLKFYLFGGYAKGNVVANKVIRDYGETKERKITMDYFTNWYNIAFVGFELRHQLCGGKSEIAFGNKNAYLFDERSQESGRLSVYARYGFNLKKSNLDSE